MAATERDDEGDYMGDLSLFLPPEFSRQISKDNGNAPICQPSSKRQKKSKKTISWQEQRKIDRERRQREEDEQTVAKCEAAIPSSNVGFKLLQRMGYTPGSSLGKDGAGREKPVEIEIRRSRAGIGRESPTKEKARREEALAERKRRKEEDLMEDFGSRKKLQWRSRRIAVDYDKARKALAQLENEEVLEPEKAENEEGDDKTEEEEEEEITEEDLEEILMKLRSGHCYCLYCGCQYESMEALSSNCPGLNDEDH